MFVKFLAISYCIIFSYMTSTACTPGPQAAALMSPLEWELIGGQDLFEIGTLPAIPPEAVDWFLREKDPEKGRKDAKKRTRGEISTREQAMERVQTMMVLGDGSLARVHAILCGLRVLDRSQSGSAAAVYQSLSSSTLSFFSHV